jgi:hypothetical protein
LGGCSTIMAGHYRCCRMASGRRCAIRPERSITPTPARPHQGGGGRSSGAREGWTQESASGAFFYPRPHQGGGGRSRGAREGWTQESTSGAFFYPRPPLWGRVRVGGCSTIMAGHYRRCRMASGKQCAIRPERSITPTPARSHQGGGGRRSGARKLEKLAGHDKTALRTALLQGGEGEESRSPIARLTRPVADRPPCPSPIWSVPRPCIGP